MTWLSQKKFSARFLF